MFPGCLFLLAVLAIIAPFGSKLENSSPRLHQPHFDAKKSSADTSQWFSSRPLLLITAWGPFGLKERPEAWGGSREILKGLDAEEMLTKESDMGIFPPLRDVPC